MDGVVSGRLVGSEIHGFHTMKDLDFPTMMEEAKTRWLRPNEIHAILCNYKFFTINVKPVKLPKSGTIVMFDRKMLRNFRKDGHNWKKKKDGKTVKEAHEHLKVGYEERIHVYYAHGEDNPTFVRRCYWLLDKTLEHIVLVHYRETQEVQGSPVTPVNSHSSSISDHSGPWLVAEDIDSGVGNGRHPRQKGSLGLGDSLNVRNHEMRLHEINTLEWDELLASSDLNNSTVPTVGDMSYFNQQHQTAINSSIKNGNHPPAYNISDTSSYDSLRESSYQINNLCVPGSVSNQSTGVEGNPNVRKRDANALGGSDSLEILVNDSLHCQDSFGMWINSIISDSPGSVDDHSLEAAVSPAQDSFTSPASFHQKSSMPEQIFCITEISSAWAYSTEKTKILVTGFFHEGYRNLGKSNLVCVCGDLRVPAEIIQVGVYRCVLSPHSPGIVSLYISTDGNRPISQVLNFEFRTAQLPAPVVSNENHSMWEEFQFQLSLAHLLFASSKNLNISCGKVSLTGLQEAKKFANKTSHLSTSWAYLMKSAQGNQIPFEQAKESLFELILKNRLKEWLLEMVLEGCKTTEYNAKGQGVIHLCAILGYTWAIHMFSWSGLSLNFRDKYGWTALHWAAFYGREKMVATLLSAGARPNLVTDPTKEYPGGCTAADLASKKGFEGLAAYLSEKSLLAQFKDMKMAGNISGTLQPSTTDTTNHENLSEEEQNLKDTLAAYRTAAEAASRIQVAFRERSLKVWTNAVRVASPEEEARNIIAAMKIQHAFRNYETRKRMAAAARIQHRFYSWKMRREFLNMRRQAIKIQAVFRGFQVRRQYRKIVWSVGVLEKVILRWRLKRKGLRGLKGDPIVAAAAQNQGSDSEEDFYKTGQKQAEDRLSRSVVTIQSMFRSKKAQQEYRRMKLAYQQALLEYKGHQERDNAMES